MQLKIFFIDKDPKIMEDLKKLMTIYKIFKTDNNINMTGLEITSKKIQDMILLDINAKPYTIYKVIGYFLSAINSSNMSIKNKISGYLLNNVDINTLYYILTNYHFNRPSDLNQKQSNHSKDNDSVNASEITSNPVISPCSIKNDLQLTSRQKMILTLVSEGKTYKEIASSLYLTERTVKYHIKMIINRLGVENRNQAITLALQNKLLQ